MTKVKLSELNLITYTVDHAYNGNKVYALAIVHDSIGIGLKDFCFYEFKNKDVWALLSQRDIDSIDSDKVKEILNRYSIDKDIHFSSDLEKLMAYVRENADWHTRKNLESGLDTITFAVGNEDHKERPYQVYCTYRAMSDLELRLIKDKFMGINQNMLDSELDKEKAEVERLASLLSKFGYEIRRKKQ